MSMDKFQQWWSQYKSKPEEERFRHFKSLDREEKQVLQKTFLQNGWCSLFCQNHVNNLIDQIEFKHNINLIDLRIRAIKFGDTFIMHKKDWEEIINMIKEYEPLYNSNILFGGLISKPWGKTNNFVVIAALRKGQY